MNRAILKKIFVTFVVTFLFHFMLLIFGPSEIFFSNLTEFDFVYGEFAGYMSIFALIGTVIFTVFLLILPKKIYEILLSIAFSFSLGGYVQIMFLNKDLDLLGETPEGSKSDLFHSVSNLLIWFAIMVFLLILLFRKRNIWRKITMYLSLFLLGIQMIALLSLAVTAKREAYVYPGPTYILSGKDQYVVSNKKNIIVIILDGFSNQYLQPMLNAYPGATDFLHDFTYYSNMDCTYYGTFPSLPHMLTGNELDMSCGVNDWCGKIWYDKKTEKFYKMLANQNYIVNVYTPNTDTLTGQATVQLLDNKFSNVVEATQNINISYKLLFKTMFKMSGYRMFPDILKPYFYTNNGEYSKIVEMEENKINHENYDFYQGLLDNGLTIDKNFNYYIVQHLKGPHDYTTDALGNYKDKSTMEETTKGCMVIVEEYLNQLKELGVYDNSSIIITADHGNSKESQVIYYIKEAGESHDISPINAAPVSHNEFLPTIAEMAGADYTEYGCSIHDFKEDEERARTLWIRESDPNYPKVTHIDGNGEGAANVYYGYTYIGDISDLLEQLELGPSVIVPVKDSFY